MKATKLVLGVVPARERDARKKVGREWSFTRERRFTRQVLDGCIPARWVCAAACDERPRGAAAQKERVDTQVLYAAEDAERGVERGPDVLNFVQIVVGPALVQRRLVRAHVRGRVIGGRIERDDVERGFGGEHATLHRVVGALDLRDVHEAGRAADERDGGEGELEDAGTDWRPPLLKTRAPYAIRVDSPVSRSQKYRRNSSAAGTSVCIETSIHGARGTG